jgi:hypothetical protein
MPVGDGMLQNVLSLKKVCVACSIETWEKAHQDSGEKTSQKLPPEIFRHLTENRSIFRIFPENGPFSELFSDTKIRSFVEKPFLEISWKKMSNSSDFTPISVIILIIFSIFSFFMFRVSQKFVSKLAFLIICLVAEGTPSKLNPTNFLPIKFIPCKNGTLRSKKQLLLCLLSFEGVQRGNISGIQEKSIRQTTETVCV